MAASEGGARCPFTTSQWKPPANHMARMMALSRTSTTLQKKVLWSNRGRAGGSQAGSVAACEREAGPVHVDPTCQAIQGAVQADPKRAPAGGGKKTGAVLSSLCVDVQHCDFVRKTEVAVPRSAAV